MATNKAVQFATLPGFSSQPTQRAECVCARVLELVLSSDLGSRSLERSVSRLLTRVSGAGANIKAKVYNHSICLQVLVGY